MLISAVAYPSNSSFYHQNLANPSKLGTLQWRSYSQSWNSSDLEVNTRCQVLSLITYCVPHLAVVNLSFLQLYLAIHPSVYCGSHQKLSHSWATQFPQANMNATHYLSESLHLEFLTCFQNSVVSIRGTCCLPKQGQRRVSSRYCQVIQMKTYYCLWRWRQDLCQREL